MVDNRRYHFSAGSLIWIFPGQVHQLVDRSPEAAYYVTVFRPDRIRDLHASGQYRGMLEAFSPTEGLLSLRPSSGQFQMLRQTMAELCAWGNGPGSAQPGGDFGLTPGFRFEHSDPAGLNAGLRHLGLCAWRITEENKQEEPVPPLHPAVLMALEHIRTSDPPRRLPELARCCGITAPTLSRLFRNEMGISLNRYRNSVMLTRFMEHMSRGRPTMLESVYAAGFGSYAQFHRVFREAYGKGPRETLNADLKNNT